MVPAQEVLQNPLYHLLFGDILAKFPFENLVAKIMYH